MQSSRIWTDLDLDIEGKQQGYFRLPLSTHQSAYGWVPIPCVSIRNGDGPRVLLMAGNHGDEYEGQVMLMKLARSIMPSDIHGHLIIMSAANSPAVEAGQRVSPLDGGNLNRTFPGSRDGSPTEMIAHFIETVILPKVDFVFDFHSGGSSLEYIPSAVVCRSSDAAKFERQLKLLEVFGMPYSIIIDSSTGEDRSLIGACQRSNKFHLSTEIGGGGSISIRSLRQAEQGLGRLLYEVEVVTHPITDATPKPSILYHRLPARKYVHATSAGIFEPFVGIGDAVVVGQPAGAIHFPEMPWRSPEVITFADDGIVLCRRVPAKTELGDCVFNLGTYWKK